MSQNARQWILQPADASGAQRIFASREEAIEAARQYLVSRGEGVILVKTPDGMVQEAISVNGSAAAESADIVVA